MLRHSQGDPAAQLKTHSPRLAQDKPETSAALRTSTGPRAAQVAARGALTHERGGWQVLGYAMAHAVCAVVLAMLALALPADAQEAKPSSSSCTPSLTHLEPASSNFTPWSAA